MNENPKLLKIENTKKLLVDVHKAGYHKVTIGKPDPDNNPACKSWPSGPYSLWGWHPSFKGYHNGDDKDARECCRQNNWPAIWEISRKYDIGGGCGNGHQHQISSSQQVILAGTFDTTSVRIINKQIKELKENMFIYSI